MITMENKQRVKTIAVIFIIAIVLISLITEFLYIFNLPVNRFNTVSF